MEMLFVHEVYKDPIKIQTTYAYLINDGTCNVINSNHIVQL